MGNPLVIYKDCLALKDKIDGITYGHGCKICNKTYICENKGYYYFCENGYHTASSQFVCNECLKDPERILFL